jgi:hypothetical protein
MKGLYFGLFLALLLTFGSGCARPQARTVPTLPPLSVPPAPPRLILPDAEPVEPAPPQEEPAVEQETGHGRYDQPPEPPTESSRVDEPREEPPPPAHTEANAQPSDPGPQLQLVTPRTGDPGEAAARIREALHRASQNLKLVNPGALKPDARTQYDTARRFVEHAEEALRVRNLVFASYLADKADTLARELVGRR